MRFILLVFLFISAVGYGQRQEYDAITLNKKWYCHDQGKQMNPQYSWQFFLGTPILWDKEDWPRSKDFFGFGHPEVNSYLKPGQSTYYFFNNDLLIGGSGLTEIDSIFLHIKYSDGFIAYIKGVEVARDNVPGIPGAPVPNSTLASSKKIVDEYKTFDISFMKERLEAGEHVMGVEIHQDDPADTVMFFQAVVTYTLKETDPLFPSVVRHPYLQMGTPTSTIIRIDTDLPTPTEIAYGTDPNNLNMTYVDTAKTKEHIVPLTDLEPYTQYYYSIEGIDGYRNQMDLQFFRTSPIPGDIKPTRIWVTGDMGYESYNQTSVYNKYLQENQGKETNLWLWLGDNAYDVGAQFEYQKNVFDVYTDILRNHMIWPSAGNHDMSSCNALTQEGPYFDMFTLPTHGEAGGVPSGSEAYFSYDYANIHFIVLESSQNNKFPNGPMLQWLMEDLKQNEQQWTIAYWHHPPYTKGSHDSDESGGLIDMREQVLPLLEKHGVDLVLSGHSHCYERSYLLDSHYGKSDSFDPEQHLPAGYTTGDPSVDSAFSYPTQPYSHSGTVYAVVGCSGNLAEDEDLDHPVHYKAHGVGGSMILEIHGDTLNAEFIGTVNFPLAEDVKDQFTIVKNKAVPCQFNNEFNLPDTLRVCEASPETLQVADRYMAYDWGNGDTEASTVVSEPGVYQVAIAKSKNCVYTKEIVAVEKVQAGFTFDNDSTPVNTPIQFQNTSYNALNYHWSFGDGNHSTEESPVHQYNTQGNYHITLISEHEACSDLATDSIMVDKTTGVHESALDKEWLYVTPNPATTHFKIRVKKAGKHRVTITTLGTKTIYQGEVEANTAVTIPIKNWATGQYILTVRGADNTALVKTLIVK